MTICWTVPVGNGAGGGRDPGSIPTGSTLCEHSQRGDSFHLTATAARAGRAPLLQQCLIRSVCRQSISDSWLGNLRECLAHLVKGSGCDCLLMQAASLLDGFSFDLFPPFKNCLTAPEVDVSRRLWVAFVGLTSTAQRVAARTRSPRRREA